MGKAAIRPLCGAGCLRNSERSCRGVLVLGLNRRLFIADQRRAMNVPTTVWTTTGRARRRLLRRWSVNMASVPVRLCGSSLSMKSAHNVMMPDYVVALLSAVSRLLTCCTRHGRPAYVVRPRRFSSAAIFRCDIPSPISRCTSGSTAPRTPRPWPIRPRACAGSPSLVGPTSRRAPWPPPERPWCGRRSSRVRARRRRPGCAGSACWRRACRPR